MKSVTTSPALEDSTEKSLDPSARGIDKDIGSHSAQLLSGTGPIATALEHFSPRPGQQQMAALIEQVILKRESVIIEAPSGSGKTLGYLVPIFVQGKKAIISTATRYLQGQLSRQDMPMLQRALGTSRTVAVLKGRNNYLCPYYLEQHLTADDGQSTSRLTATVRAELLRIAQLFRVSSSGEISRLAPNLDPAVLPLLTCSAEECLNDVCPQLSRCPVIRARKKAQQADIVVINHSLLFSDQLMRREQLGKLLPDSEVVVIDEAHRLADFAQTLVGEHINSSQLSRFCRDGLAIIQGQAPEQRAIIDYLQQLQQVIGNLQRELPERRQHVAVIEQLQQAINRLSRWLLQLQERDSSLYELSVRALLLDQKLKKILDDSGLCWIEQRGRSFVLQQAPLNLSIKLQSLIATGSAAWVFTSATLSVAGSADRFMNVLGLQAMEFHRLNSAIDYWSNARLFLPRLTVAPGHSEYTGQLVEQVAALVAQLDGHYLLLFSSHQALKLAANALQQKVQCPLFVQGTAANELLIDRFRCASGGLLLGTGSFWEGLDLSGVALSVVIIDKLPFASPRDPLIELRSNDLARHGVDSFEQYLLADAVIRLRQGCGRLLRRLPDRGVIMLADPRLHSKPYGEVFLDSLPAMQRCYSTESIADFFHKQLPYPGKVVNDKELNNEDTGT